MHPESTMQTAILSSIGIVSFPEYKVSRNKNVFTCRKASIYYFIFLEIEKQIDSLSTGVPAADTESWQKVWAFSKPYVLFWSKVIRASFISEIELGNLNNSNEKYRLFDADINQAQFLLDMGIPSFATGYFDNATQLGSSNSSFNLQPETNSLNLFKNNSSNSNTSLNQQSSIVHNRFEYWRRRFTACWVLTRIAEKSLKALAALGLYFEESIILRALIAQHWFKSSHIGKWYRRLTLVQMNYLISSNPNSKKEKLDSNTSITHSNDYCPNQSYIDDLYMCRETCIQGLLNPNISIFDAIHIEKRLNTLDKRIGIPEHLQLKISKKALCDPETITIYGVKANVLKKKTVNSRLLWVGLDGECCSVEQVALYYYTETRGMVAVHSESSILTSIFAFLFWDIIFYPIDGAFDTEYQNKPLDMYTECFYINRKELIDQRIQEIRDGEAIGLIHVIYNREKQRNTCTVGVNWDYSDTDLYDLCMCLGPNALAEICYYIAIDYKSHSSGVPDICAWNPSTKQAIFSEVKGPGDTLSETQKGWIDLLISSNVSVELCLVREECSEDRPSKKHKKS
ncbi:hypothetical protein BB561_005572 [Smittium simulii]|nr:hypothetical protein BB561_005572 [Smittium simulii]